MVFTKRGLCRIGSCVVAILIVLAIGCAKKPKPTTEVVKPPAPPVEKPIEQPGPPEQPEPRKADVVLAAIFFDYDKYNLREDARRSLEENARTLMENMGIRVLLEGHCDERGTVEYNLALGDRRAQSAKNFLVEFGIDASRLSTISYGEERPFAQGHDEGAWSQNRRVHFVIQQ